MGMIIKGLFISLQKPKRIDVLIDELLKSYCRADMEFEAVITAFVCEMLTLKVKFRVENRAMMLFDSPRRQALYFKHLDYAESKLLWYIIVNRKLYFGTMKRGDYEGAAPDYGNCKFNDIVDAVLDREGLCLRFFAMLLKSNLVCSDNPDVVGDHYFSIWMVIHNLITQLMFDPAQCDFCMRALTLLYEGQSLLKIWKQDEQLLPM